MSNIKIFEGKEIRAEWDNEKEDWLFSVADVCNVLSESQSKDKSSYWRNLKARLKKEGSQVVSNCYELKLIASDGKPYKTDVMYTKDILRVIQSIPSPKAEPFKLWLAQVGSDRLDEIADPEKAMQRGADFYRMKGYSPEWITQRLLSIKIRKELTDEWKERAIEKESDYAILTNELTKAWSGLSIKEYKNLKNLKKESLRDNMTDIELTLNQLAELTTKQISSQEKPTTFADSKKVARRGGKVANTAKKEYEKATGTKVVSGINATNKNLLDTKIKNNK
ncbi:MAG: Bro-N domain-containing protein [Clostridia bacterium]|nr:Bro-N domain-containing protein [Clostridia bacterium]